MNNCLCKPAKCLLTALIALTGAKSHSSVIKKVHRAVQLKDLFLHWSRVKPNEGEYIFKVGLWVADLRERGSRTGLQTSHLHLEWKDIVKEHKAINTGKKDQQMPSSFFLPLKYLPQHARGLRPLCLMGLGFLMLPVVSYSVSMWLIPAEQQRSSKSLPAEQLEKKHRSMLAHERKSVALVIPQLLVQGTFRERAKKNHTV